MAASSEAPNDSRYEPSARGLRTMCTKSLQSIEPAISTRAASGSSTRVLRKNVVKPNVRPKPGSTLGWRSGRAPRRMHAGLRLAVHDRAPASAAAVRAAGAKRSRRSAASGPNAQDQHLPGRTRPRRRASSLRRVAEAQLGAHLQAVHGLRFRARIQQLRACRAGAGGIRRASGHDVDVDRFGGHVAQQAGGDGERGACAPPRPTQWISTRCGDARVRRAAPALRRAPRRSSHSMRCGAVGVGGDAPRCRRTVSAPCAGGPAGDPPAAAPMRVATRVFMRAASSTSSGWRLRRSASGPRSARRR